MTPVDQRDILDEEPFDYKELKDNKIQIYWKNKPVMLVKGLAAKKLLMKIEKASDKEIQLALAKITGNFKRGNEKSLQKD